MSQTPFLALQGQHDIVFVQVIHIISNNIASLTPTSVTLSVLLLIENDKLIPASGLLHLLFISLE